MSSFSQQMSSFFDELTNIVDKKKKDREKDLMRHTERPFPNILTQDDEPGDYYNPAPIEEQEPGVVTRGE